MGIPDMGKRDLQATPEGPQLVPALDGEDGPVAFDANLDHDHLPEAERKRRRPA
jgi:hypothetical protein